ncbi:hypothetical protein MKW92_015191 [Papaver armeniacum]|nr:hypothetical protein MKW92_015191 [Papaver armeniacum]
MHGNLDNVYGTLLHLELVVQTKIDLLIYKDLESLNVKPNYRSMNSFWKYYSGQEVAPFRPNIYFLGFAGVIKFGTFHIGGLSGIYNASPYNYLVHEYDVYKLMQKKRKRLKNLSIFFLSHDWPVGITDYGNWPKAVGDLLEKLNPPHWFSAHLHCKFAALVQHGESGPATKFLALDKCLPGCKLLQIIQYDEEWLAVTRKFNPIFPLASWNQKNFQWMENTLNFKLLNHEWVKSKLATRGLKPFVFVQTVHPYNPNQSMSSGSLSGQSKPQAISLLQLLELPYLLDVAAESEHSPMPYSSDHKMKRLLMVMKMTLQLMMWMKLNSLKVMWIPNMIC